MLFLVAAGFTTMIFLEKDFTPPIPTWFIIIIMGVALPVWLVLSAFKFKIEITTTSIVITTLFKKRELKLEHIKGFKYLRQGYIMVLVHRDDSALDMSFEQAILRTNGLKEWIKESFDDITEEDVEVKAIRQSQNLDEAATARGIDKANKNAKVVSGIFVLYSFLIFFYQGNSSLVAVLSFFLPLTGLYFIYINRGFVKLHFSTNRKTSPLYTLSLLLLITSIALQTRRTDIVDHSAVLLVVTQFTVLFVILSVIAIRKNLILGTKGNRIEEVMIVLMLAIIYGYASAINVNVGFDNSTPVESIQRVLEKKAEGESRAIFISVGAEQIEVNVSRDLFEKNDSGDKIRVYQKQGFLGIPWIWKVENKKIPHQKGKGSAAS
ncbi:hypothetical protein BKI52_08880 [marine bacterium AO1-C]|nr:hypothetical protein BKI52_08880 [marine bacterium AO1-C]